MAGWEKVKYESEAKFKGDCEIPATLQKSQGVLDWHLLYFIAFKKNQSPVYNLLKLTG